VILGIVAGGVLTVLVAWGFHRRRHVPLALNFSPTSVVPLGSADLADRVEVLFKGTPISRPWVARFRIRNPGPRHIDEGAFREPLTISAPPTAVVLAVSVQSAPRALDIMLRADGRYIRVEPFLLNSGEAFDLDALVDSRDELFSSSFKVEHRIAGLAMVSHSFERDTKVARVVGGGMIGTGAAAVAAACVFSGQLGGWESDAFQAIAFGGEILAGIGMTVWVVKMTLRYGCERTLL
jgi:hypothetical protein